VPCLSRASGPIRAFRAPLCLRRTLRASIRLTRPPTAPWSARSR
jgi:hypothetical protein